MPSLERLHTTAPWLEVATTADDWATASAERLGTMLTSLQLVRAFEETVLELAGEGLVHGPAHSSIGQEGVAVGCCGSLRGSDQVNGSHRGHHVFLAKALAFLADRFDPTAEIAPEVESLLHRTLAEIAGLAEGFCKGRGGSMHLRWPEAGVL
ncbi:MAG: MFS transporter, partial [Acidobacteria bacterium]|nr:MFS transporter [Acidobacteriota bacterium]